MYQQEIESPYGVHDAATSHQGDIYRDILVLGWRYTADSSDDYDVISNTYPYVVLITQECDLEQDHQNRNSAGDKHDKYLQSLLVCPAYQAEIFKRGEHLDQFSLKMEKWNSDRFRLIKRQMNERYHFLENDINLQIPNLVIDFKHYFTIPTETLYHIRGKKYLASLRPLFREELSHRFSFFLSRIGLPEIVPPNP